MSRDSAPDDDGPDRLARDVLRKVDVPRRSSDISFVLGDPAMTTRVEEALSALRGRGWVSQSDSGLWHRTDEGAAGFRRLEQWTVEVSDVFPVSMRLRPIVTGWVLDDGAVYENDWFTTADGKLGRVLTVEFFPRSSTAPPADAVAFTSDIELSAGEVIVSTIPMAAEG